MRITGIQAVPVNVPLEAPIRWSWGVRDETNRTIVIVETDEGLQGLGETLGGAYMPVIINSMAAEILGEDPFNIERILARFQMVPYFTGYAGRAAVSAIEMACWDLIGKKLETPLYRLLGGEVRKEVSFAAFVFSRYEKDGVGGEDTPEKIASHCLSLYSKMGFRVFKLKGGVFAPEFDLETLDAMARSLPKTTKFRYDPNGAWSLETAYRLCPELLEYNLEYLEDIVWGLDATARLRASVQVPMATNMFVVSFEDLPLNAKLEAFDVILGDIHKWGGISATKNLAAVCQTFSWGMSMHSGAELGISTAATVQVAASTPQIYLPLDTHYYHLSDDIILESAFEFTNGCLKVPEGNGLGVTLDKNKLDHYHSRYKERGAIDHAKGDASASAPVGFRPQW